MLSIPNKDLLEFDIWPLQNIDRYLQLSLIQTVAYNERIPVDYSVAVKMFKVDGKMLDITVDLNYIEKRYFEKFIKDKHHQYIHQFIKAIELCFLGLMVSYKLHNKVTFKMIFKIEDKVYEKVVDSRYITTIYQKD